MTERKVDKLLPEYLQNDQLKKFFDATANQLFEPEKTKKISGFVGRVPPYHNPQTDFYLNEPTAERQAYQLEPVLKSQNNNLSYPDLVNHLRYQGANIDNHSRLFEQKFYSWSPPIDVDMFINYSDYYWYPEGPTVIQLRGNSTKAIDVDNEIIGQKSFTSPNGIAIKSSMHISFGNDVIPASYIGTQWIVEGVGDSIILIPREVQDSDQYPQKYNDENKDYLTINRGSITQNPWSRSNHWYHKDLISFDDIDTIEDEESIKWDADPWDSTVWDSTITEIKSNVALDTSRQAKRPIICFDANIELYDYGSKKGQLVDLLVKDETDIFSNIQGKEDGTVVIDGVTLNAGDRILVISDLNPLVNNRVYDVDVIEVSPNVFQYVINLDTSVNLNGNTEVGDKVLIRLGDTEKGSEYHYTVNGYQTSQEKLQANQAPLFRLYDTNGISLDDNIIYPSSTFSGSTIFQYGYGDGNVVDPELGFVVEYRNFNQISEIVFDHTLKTNQYSYEIAPQERANIPQYYYYHDVNSGEFLNSWYLSPELSSQKQKNGFYEIPSNLQANADNDEVTTVSRSDILAHFTSIIDAQGTDYRNSARERGLGTEILQHQAPLTKTMVLAANESLDFATSLRFSQNEYRRFYNKLLNKLETFNNNMSNDLSASTWLDDAIRMINTSKTPETFPFGTNRMLPSGPNYIKQEIMGFNGQVDYEIDFSFDETSTTSIDAVSVYVDGTIQVIDQDYEISGNQLTFKELFGGNVVIEVRYYDSVLGSFVPSTPASMGITPVYRPRIVMDDTYVEDRRVIVTHDGSKIPVYNDFRDEVILEFETRIFNTIREKHRKGFNVLLDGNSILSGKFRNTGYSILEQTNIYSSLFTTWASKANIDWAENTTYSSNDWKTWNWSATIDKYDNQPLYGSWRAIYQYYFDTDRPHTHPWEMLGFSIKPEWWDVEYGTYPYPSSNDMWDDLQDGFIRQGERMGIDPLYIRPRLKSIIPVDNNGELLNPFDAGIANKLPNRDEGSMDWNIGDMSPAETAFHYNPEAQFIKTEMMYLMRPTQIVELFWDTDCTMMSSISKDQLINGKFGYRPSISELYVSGENNTYIQGVQNWVIDYLKSFNLSSDILGEAIRNTNIQLGWKSASFVKSTSLRMLADSYSPSSISRNQKVFIQDDDLSVDLYRSKSIEEPIYSGVIVEWDGDNFVVYGYDQTYPFFRTIPAIENSRTVPITVGEITVSEKKDSDEFISEVPYGTKFSSRQEVYDFLIAYQKWLEHTGWVFDEYDNSSNEIKNFRYSGKEFLFWTLDDLEIGSFIALSPFADKATFKTTHGFIANVEEIIKGTYTILNRSGNSIPIREVDTFRNKSAISVATNSEEGIYALRLSVQTYEHIVLVNNITRFNDVVYQPLFNLRQSRLKVIGTGVNDWTGKFEAAGYFLDSTNNYELTPNFEKTTTDILHYNDVNNPPDNDAIIDSARHLIGYQRREYLNQLLVDRDVQYEFYQGLIHQKGSRNTLNKLFRSSAITTSNDVQFFEEWAIRVGTYGGTDIMPPFEFSLTSDDITTDPQVIRFVDGNQADSPRDNIIDILPNDPRWISRFTSNDIEFPTRDKKYYKRDLPNAGYPQLGETDYLASNVYKLFDDTNPVFNATYNNTVWVARDSNNILKQNWDVLSLQEVKDYVWYTSSLSNDRIESYHRDIIEVVDGNRVFVSTSGIPLDEDYIYVYNDDKVIPPTKFQIMSDNVIEITEDLVDGSFIIIDSLTQHSVVDANIVYLTDDEQRIASIVVDMDDTSITLSEDFSPEAAIVEGTLGLWETRRFKDTSSLSTECLCDEIRYIDNDENGWAVYQTDGNLWRKIREEEPLVDTSLVKNGIIFDDKIDRIRDRLTVIDPFKGYIAGLADVEIAFKLDYDPAKYTTNNFGDSFDADLAWGNEQIGQVWWDTTSATFLYYEQGSIDYKTQHWGKLFPDSEIKLYEWVRSPVPPSGWADYIQNSNDQFNFSSSGTVKDIDSDDGPSWVERIEINNETGYTQTYYYFWVENSTSTPNIDHRSIPLTEIERIIIDPVKYGISYCSPIASKMLIVSNVVNSLESVNTALQINFNNPDDDQVPIHKQWELIREGDDFSVIKDMHWNKMRDSLVGYDDLGNNVPDISLKGTTRYGHNVRPRQTWFTDKILARKIFFEAINQTMVNIDLTTELNNPESHLYSGATLDVEPNVVKGSIANPTITPLSEIQLNGIDIVFSGIGGTSTIVDEINTAMNSTPIYAEIRYEGSDTFVNIINELGGTINIVNTVGDALSELGINDVLYIGEGPNYIVQTSAEKDALNGLINGDRIYVVSDETYNNIWTYWTYNGSDFDVLAIQSYSTQKYWSMTDWYLTGYDDTLPMDFVVPTLNDRPINVPEKTTVKVLNDGSGKWVKYELNNGKWLTISKEDATIKFSEKLYVSEIDKYGYDQSLYDSTQYDGVPTIECREIINALRNEILIGKNKVEQNKLFFKMIKHVHSTQNIVDWCFKTSYIYLVGFSESLSQRPVFTYDGFESLIDYINEVKPYHTKIKDVVRTLATTTDISEWKATDFDRPVYIDPETGKSRILDGDNSEDVAILSTKRPWVDWYKEYQVDNGKSRKNNVRKIKTTMTLDRVSAIRKDFIPRVPVTHVYDPYDISPFYKNKDAIDGKITQSAPEWNIVTNYTGGTLERGYALINRKPCSSSNINIITSGDLSNASTIDLVGYKSPTLSGDSETFMTITDVGTVEISYLDIQEYPYLSVEISNYNIGDDITVRISARFDNALSRIMKYYSQQNGQPNIDNLITSEYQGIILDGSQAQTSAGWDVSGWDISGWDSVTNNGTNNSNTVSGGSFKSYMGDGTENTFTLPEGNGPWAIYASDTTNVPVTPIILVEGTNFTINPDDTATLIAGFSWMDGPNLRNNWSIVILDSTFKSESSYDIVVDGYKLKQPNEEGYPEELVPIASADNLQINVQTNGNIGFSLLDNVTTTTIGKVVTFGNQTPLSFVLTEAFGNTVILEGSNTGEFTGEETLIDTFYDDNSFTIPDSVAGYESFTYYRASVTSYGLNAPTMYGEISVGVNSVKDRFMGNGVQDTFQLNNNIVGNDDLIVSIDDVIVETFTTNVSTDEITFNSPPSNGAKIQVTSWGSANTLNSMPVKSKETFTGTPMDLTSFGGIDVLPNPTMPNDGSMMVFAGNGSLFSRLTPPEINYYNADGIQEEFVITKRGATFTPSDVTVYVNNILETGYSISGDRVVFNTPPTDKSIVSIRVLDNDDYYVDGNNLVISNSGLIGDEIMVISFKDNDGPVGIRTVTYSGHSDDFNGSYCYYAENNAVSKDFVVVTKNGTDILKEDYSIRQGIGWDSNGWDNGVDGWDGSDAIAITLNEALTPSDEVTITTLSGTPAFDTVSYKEFIGRHNYNDTIHEFIRISDQYSTVLTKDVSPDDRTISIDNPNILTKSTGVIWINGERIEYNNVNGNVLSQLVRGTYGTRKNKTHKVGDKVINGSKDQLIEDMENKVLNDFYRRLQASDNARANFINKESGTIR